MSAENTSTNVVCLSDWLQRNKSNYVQCLANHCTAWHPISKPQGARSGDVFVTSEVLTPEPFAAAGIREGDFLIFAATDEVKHGDLVALYRRGNVLLGFLHEETPDTFCLHSATGEILFGTLTRREVRIIGRVVEVQRDSRPVNLSYPLRPLHAAWSDLGVA
jgi:hypothetical protein